MARMNEQGREVWFERWLWSYLPCHWKGWAALIGAITVGLGATLILSAGFPKYSSLSFLSFIPLLAVVLALWIVSERHCP